jgi:plasmid stabilization system protein ParE
MLHKIELSGRTRRDIEAISEYIAQDSPLNAYRWLEGVDAAFESLRNSPTRHAILYTPPQAGREVRQTFYGVYRILYEIRDETVYVLTVRHGARRPIGPAEVRGLE